MLASLIASTFAGHYTYMFLPFLLPTPVVLALLPPEWTTDEQSPFLSPEQLQAAGIDVPSPPEGYSWVCIEAGKQIKTGMNAPGGRMTFFEAKLEIPFLRHPSSPSDTLTPYTFKQTLLFSTSLMTASSHYITGLRSQKTNFKVEDAFYEAVGWLKIQEGTAGEGERWTEESVRQVVGGWWVGERTGGVATRFLTSPSSPASPSSFSLRLHLPSFARISVERVKDLFVAHDMARMDGEGWLELEVEGWKLDEEVKMEVGKVGHV